MFFCRLFSYLDFLSQTTTIHILHTVNAPSPAYKIFGKQRRMTMHFVMFMKNISLKYRLLENKKMKWKVNGTLMQFKNFSIVLCSITVKVTLTNKNTWFKCLQFFKLIFNKCMFYLKYLYLNFHFIIKICPFYEISNITFTGYIFLQ